MRRKLYREPNEGFVGGVCAGLETHTGIDALVWRLATLFIPGGGCMYILLWILTEEI